MYTGYIPRMPLHLKKRQSETASVIKRSFPARRTTALPMEYVRRYNHGRLAVKDQIDALYPRFYLNTNLLAEIRHCNEKM